MALGDVAPPMGLTADSLPVITPASDSSQPHIRKRRMNFFDLNNLLNSDGNLQNEMMVFAFAATMLSTIPVLLGSEFDANVGLRRRRQAGPYKDPDQAEFMRYAAYTQQFPPPYFSGYTYKQLMTTPPGMQFYHIHNSTSTHEAQSMQENIQDMRQSSSQPDLAKETIQTRPQQKLTTTDASLTDLLEELLQWSQQKVKDKPLLPLLINLVLDKYNGNTNPADKLIKTAYKKWIKYWY